MEIEAIHHWIKQNEIKNERGDLIDFKDHMFMYRIYDDFSRELVIKKAAQVGMSVCATIKKFYLAHKKSVSTIYTLPTDSDITEFVPTKVDKIIAGNPSIREMLKKDNVFLKQVGDAFIYYKGTYSKSAPIMTTADLLVHDELDRSDMKIVDQFSERTAGYKGSRETYGGRWSFSNPSIANSGVDLDWKRSDKKEWFITCRNCKEEQTLNWKENVDFKRGIYVCKACGYEIDDYDRRQGRWVATDPEKEVSGYHISQLMAPWLSARDLIKKEREQEPDTFTNFVLGEPTSAGHLENFTRLIMDAYTHDTLDIPPFILGVDIGRVKHWVLGSKRGIFKVGVCESREELKEIIERWNPLVVMDAGPERTWVEEFIQEYPNVYIVFFQRDKERRQLIWMQEDEDAHYIKADRNRVIDKVVDELAQGDIEFHVEPSQLALYTKHWNYMIRREEETPQGGKRFVWDVNKVNAPDHWVFATVYYYIGRALAGNAVFKSSENKKVEIVTEVSPGKFKMADIDKIIKKQHDA